MTNPNRDTLNGLAARAEAATADETREILEESFRLCGLDTGPRPRISFARFQRMLDASAFVDAALMLVREGLHIQMSDWQHDMLRQHGPWQCILVRDRDDFNDTFKGRCDHAATLALAIVAAALRAKAASL